MNKNEITIGSNKYNIIENESTSKKLLIFYHGLDGSANFAKPLFQYFNNDIKLIAVEQRGHTNSSQKPSRFIGNHLKDYIEIIKHYSAEGYKIWLMGESMGAGYASLLAYKKYDLPIEGIFAQSIPNTIINLQEKNFWYETKVSMLTLISFITNINFYHKQRVRYELMSNNPTLQRLAKLDDKTKKTSTLERLSTWALTKRIWKLYASKKHPKYYIKYFSPTFDPLCNLKKTELAFKKNKKDNLELFLVPFSKHILMYEKGYERSVLEKIKFFIDK